MERPSKEEYQEAMKMIIKANKAVNVILIKEGLNKEIPSLQTILISMCFLTIKIGIQDDALAIKVIKLLKPILLPLVKDIQNTSIKERQSELFGIDFNQDYTNLVNKD